MRGLAVVLALAGCGRLGFDTQGGESGDAGGPGFDSGSGGPAVRSFSSLCDFQRALVILDGQQVDDTVGMALVSAVAGGCNQKVVEIDKSQDTSGLLDPPTGRPLTKPAQLLVTGGGDGPNREIAYLLMGDSPLVWSGTDNALITLRRTGQTIAAGPVGTHHDFAFVQVIFEPIGGTTTLSAQGIARNGTQAAALVFTQLAVGLGTNANAWAVVEWTDSDNDSVATDADTFVTLATGN